MFKLLIYRRIIVIICLYSLNSINCIICSDNCSFIADPRQPVSFGDDKHGQNCVRVGRCRASVRTQSGNALPNFFFFFFLEGLYFKKTLFEKLQYLKQNI